MAGIHLQPPQQFNFKQPDGWSSWKHRFNQFRVASGLDQDPSAKQVSTLIYCMGEEAEVILVSTNITEEERKSYPIVCARNWILFSEFEEMLFLCKRDSTEDVNKKVNQQRNIF